MPPQDAHVRLALEERAHHHGRVEVEVWIFREHRLEPRRVVESEVRHDDDRVRMTIERAPQSIGARHRSGVQAIGRIRRLWPAMDHHRLAPPSGRAPHGIEARIVGSDPHHVRVDLHPAEGTGQRCFTSRGLGTRIRSSPGKTVQQGTTSGFRRATSSVKSFRARARPGLCT